MKKWKYNISYNFDFEDKHYSLLTQVYKIGIYGIWNNDPAQQCSYSPGQLVKLDKQINKDFEAGIITNLETGRAITVIKDENGFYEELKD